MAGRYAGLKARIAHLRAVPLPQFDLESGERAAHDILRHDPPDAIVCANDEVALGVLLAAEQHHLPDLAVTG